jgi:hypothetical protein
MDMESSSLGQIQWNFFSSICVEREGVCVFCGVLGMEAYYHQRTQINGTSSCVVFMEGVREGGKDKDCLVKEWDQHFLMYKMKQY